MNDQLKSVTFALVLCVVCSLLLTAASTLLKPRQMRNMLADKHRNVLAAVGLVGTEKRSADEIERLYSQAIRAYWIDEQGRIVDEKDRKPGFLPLYVHEKNGAIEAYVVPIDTRGLWGEIHGYLALDRDGSTIRGFSVYQHSETPGLGGEIEQQWFRNNFVGKRIVDQQGNFVSISIAKGKVAQTVPAPLRPNYVDGISGASMTGRFLTAGLRTILEQYEPVAIRFRQQSVGPLPGR